MAKSDQIEIQDEPPAVPAEDPTTDDGVVKITYTALFRDFFDEVLFAISGVGNTRVNTQAQYRLKAADIAQWLVSVSLAQSRQTPA